MANIKIRINVREARIIGITWSINFTPSVEINPRTFLEFYLFLIARSGLPLGNLEVIFIKRYGYPRKSLIKYSNVARQKPL